MRSNMATVMLNGPLPNTSGGGALLLRVRSEFLEMPGLRLTTGQAARLWGLDSATSESLLDHLVATGFLWKRENGTYMRMSGE
jgi:hypothetical protein